MAGYHIIVSTITELKIANNKCMRGSICLMIVTVPAFERNVLNWYTTTNKI